MELVLLEGSSIGRDWRAYWMGKDTGAQYAAPVAAPVVLHEITVPGATGTQVITGALGTPRAVIALGGQAAAGSENASMRWSMGTALRQTTGSGYGNTDGHVRSQDADTTPSTRAGSSGASLLTHLNVSAGTVEQRAEVTNMAVDEFTLNWTAVTLPGTVGMISIPTDLLTHAAYGLLTMLTAPGTTDVVCADSLSAGNFEPDVVLFWLSGFHTSPAQVASTTVGAVFFGVAINGGFHGCVSGGVMNTTSAVPSDTYQFISDADAIRIINANTGAFIFEATVSFLANGFRLNVTTGASGSFYLRWIAFKGTAVWKGGVAQAPTAPGTQALDVTGMYPSVVMGMGISSATLGTIVANLGIAHGAAGRDPATQLAAWLSAVDGVSPTQCDNAVRDAFLYFGTDNAPATATARADVSAWAQDEITLNWTVASTAFRFLWLACGTT